MDVQRGSDRVPEFVARREKLKAAVEVDNPIEWEGLSALVEELREPLMNLDLPLDFESDIRVDQLDDFDGEPSTHPPGRTREAARRRHSVGDRRSHVEGS